MPQQSRFRSILLLQWKSSRFMVLTAAILAFALPVISVRSTASADVRAILREMEGWGVGYTMLAAGLGLIIAMGVWSADQRGRHVYALALPMERWRYTALKFCGGLVCLAPVIVTLLVGTLVAVQIATLPPGLHAYPLAVTIRFTLAALLAFAVFFAISAATPRTAGAVMVAIVLVVVVQYVLRLSRSEVDLFGRVYGAVFATRGALGVFTARWMLIDV